MSCYYPYVLLLQVIHFIYITNPLSSSCLLAEHTVVCHLKVDISLVTEMCITKQTVAMLNRRGAVRIE